MKNAESHKLMSLISRMRSLVPAETSAPECREIVWTEPHHYAADQIEMLSAMSVKLAACLQKTLQYYCDEGFSVQADGLSEHFASFLAADVKQSKKNWYFLPLVQTDKSQAGFLELSFESSACLIAQMLRDPEAQIGQSGEISALEQTILLDILQALSDSLVDELAMYQVKLNKSDQLVFGEWPMRFRELQDMTRVLFKAECGSASFTLALCLRDEVIDPIAGIVPVVHSVEDIKKCPERVIGRMNDVPMQVSARLSSAMMTLNDILSLEKGDIVVLDRKVDSPIDVLVNGQMCFKAWPARHTGRAAVLMTASESI